MKRLKQHIVIIKQFSLKFVKKMDRGFSSEHKRVETFAKDRLSNQKHDSRHFKMLGNLLSGAGE